MLLASPTSRYEGRPSAGPLPATAEEVHPSIQVRANLGIVGDRYFGKPAHRNASVTLMAAEALEAVRVDLGLTDPLDPVATRRNILLAGVDIDSMRGATISLDTGDGPVLFQLNRPANPCAWMDVVLAPGAFRALRGRGGMRAEPLSDGMLRLGPALLRSSLPLDPVHPAPLQRLLGSVTAPGGSA